MHTLIRAIITSIPTPTPPIRNPNSTTTENMNESKIVNKHFSSLVGYFDQYRLIHVGQHSIVSDLERV